MIALCDFVSYKIRELVWLSITICSIHKSTLKTVTHERVASIWKLAMKSWFII